MAGHALATEIATLRERAERIGRDPASLQVTLMHTATSGDERDADNLGRRDDHRGRSREVQRLWRHDRVPACPIERSVGDHSALGSVCRYRRKVSQFRACAKSLENRTLRSPLRTQYPRQTQDGSGNPLNEHGVSHATRLAHCQQPVTTLAALQLVNKRGQQCDSRCAQWVT